MKILDSLHILILNQSFVNEYESGKTYMGGQEKTYVFDLPWENT